MPRPHLCPPIAAIALAALLLPPLAANAGADPAPPVGSASPAGIAGTASSAGVADTAPPAERVGAATPGADAFTPTQRAAIVAIMRDALQRDPSILADAINALRAADQRDEARAATGAIASHRAELADGDAVGGNPRGDVTLVEFYDPRCPYCRKMLPTVDAAMRSDHRLRVLYRVIPILGPGSTLAARAIVAAGLHGLYRPMQEALMAEDAPGENTPADVAGVLAAAKRLGLDQAAFETAMNSDAVTARLRANLALAHALGIDGTPAFVLGDTLVPGAMTDAELRKLLASAEG